MAKKRICFFSGDITRNGGTERVSILIANELVKSRDDQIIFLSLVEQNKVPFYKIDPGIKRFSLGEKWLSPGPAYLPLIPKLRSFLKRENIDLIIDIDIVLDVLSVPATVRRKTKVISWEHSNCEYELAQGYRRIILKHFTKRTDWIVTLTPGDARKFRTVMKRENRISSIFNPIREPIGKLPESRENAMITVARLVPAKGFDLLMEVAGKVLPKHPDWKWYLCGEGPERERLTQFCKEQKLESQLILCGQVTDVEEYLAKAKLFVFTSRAEGLPMCLLEARTMGVPCISFDIPTGPADIIQDGVNGFLIEPFDCEAMARKMNELLVEPDRLANMGEQALRNLEPFFMERVVAQWCELMDHLVE